MNGLLRPFRHAVIALVAITATASAAHAAGGTVSGSIAGTLPKAGKGAATVQVFGGSSGQLVAAVDAGKRGAFSLKLPADGAYVVQTIVVAKGKAPLTTSAPVSVKKGQKRQGLKLTPKRKKAPKAKKKSAAGALRAARSFVREDGSSTPGTTAVSVEPFTGGTGDWGYVGNGIGDILTSDLVNGALACPSVVIANSQGRELVAQELELEKSKYFDPKTVTKRNFIKSDVVVRGSLTSSSDGGSATAHVEITDGSTGAVLDSFDTTLHDGQVFDESTQLAKQIGERACRRPSAYELTMATHDDATFATHTASADLGGTLTALRSGGEAGQAPTAWSGTANYQPSNFTYAAKTTTCNVGSPVLRPGTWTAQLTAGDGGTVALSWDSPTAFTMSTLTFTCKTSAGSTSIPGAPGPTLTELSPKTATLPATGGTVNVAGTFQAQDGSGGWTTTGTITVKPIWGTDAPST